MKRLLAGYRAFKAQRWPEERAHYEELAKRGQNPEYLVIACSDSRADPATIFDASPGELFVVRNVAAIVPPFESDATHHGTSAAIAFAVLSLNVRNIVVMGHAQCGGIAAALNGKLAKDVPFLSHWIELLEPALAHSEHIADHAARHVAMERDSVRLSLANLLTFPFVAERVRADELMLHGARFGIANGQLEILDPKTDAFVAVE
ncbi:MAG TPA: carbonic anhydrase [Rhizomicrobium sp.]|nr:carbonic anhydrase [Rhizomicrobium sp.]